MFKWLRQKHANTPVMFRVRHKTTGQYVDAVDVSGVFDERQVVKGRRHAAAGLCMIHWPTGARRLDVTFHRDGAEASVTVLSTRPDPHLVFNVDLEPTGS